MTKFSSEFLSLANDALSAILTPDDLNAFRQVILSSEPEAFLPLKP